MTELLDTYIADIEKSFSLVKGSLSTHKQSSLSKKESTLPSLKVELYQMEKLIKLMETQIVTFEGKQKNISAQKIKAFKLEFQTLRKKVTAFDQEIRNQRNKQKQSPVTTSHSLELNQRSSSKSSKYSKLEESQDEDVNLKLKESVKAMYEMEAMSDNIGHELASHTKKLEESTSKLGRIRGELMKGEKKIKKMMIRLRKNQLVFYLIILMMVLMAAFMVSRIF